MAKSKTTTTETAKVIRKYGWTPDLPDHRDKVYKPKFFLSMLLPSQADLSSKQPPIYDQQTIGSCTGNGTARVVQFDEMKQKESGSTITPSRLQIYYDARAIEGTTSSDSGAQIRDAVKAVITNGAAPETLWPYDITKFAVKPPANVYQSAAKRKAIVYSRIDNTNLSLLKKCIVDGYPFVFGFTVYDYFESQEMANTGVLPMPGPDESVIGGHCVVATAFNDNLSYPGGKGMFKIANSWGKNWGLRDSNGNGTGEFLMPYKYITNENLASDFWEVKSIS